MVYSSKESGPWMLPCQNQEHLKVGMKLASLSKKQDKRINVCIEHIKHTESRKNFLRWSKENVRKGKKELKEENLSSLEVLICFVRNGRGGETDCIAGPYVYLFLE